MTTKTKLPPAYTDRVIEYFNELLDIAARGGYKSPQTCGMCDASRVAVGDVNCGICPVSWTVSDGRYCTNRRAQIKKNSYRRATPAEIIARVEWMARQHNKHVDSGWLIEIKEVKS